MFSFLSLKIKVFAGILFVIIFAGVGFALLKGPKIEAVLETGERAREVEVALVSELSKESTPLPVLGTVRSVSEATLQAEAQGKVTAIYRKIGDYLVAGNIIAEIENSRERAALLQAEAGLSSAKASLGISSISKDKDIKLYEEARLSAVNTLKNAYDSVEDAVETKIDPMFSNPKSINPQWSSLSSNSQTVIYVNDARIKVGEILKAEELRSISLSASQNLELEITLTEEEVRFVKSFMDNVIIALNSAVPTLSVPQTTIDAWKITAAGARTSLQGVLTSLSSTRDILNTRAAQASVSTSQAGSSEGSLGEATIKQAEALLLIAQSNYEKTIIRSPISGTLNTLDIERGSFVTPFQEVAIISNNQALEIQAYVTEEDRKEIKVGADAIVEGQYAAVVTRVSPALDPKTKKVEVLFGLREKADLTNGSSVRVEIKRDDSPTERISIPLSAIKLGASDAIVFTVDEENRLVSHQISMGPLLGEKVIILEGLTLQMSIVRDARGLKEGGLVLIKD